MLAWKQGGHKTMCKMKRHKHLEGTSQAISKSDTVFFHHLSIRDTRHHLPLLRHLAHSTYPMLRSCELLIHIDYTAVLPVYSIVPLAEMEHHEARHLVHRLRGPLNNVYSVMFIPETTHLYC
ncbi:hypothetical protein B0H14DRAFT_3426891 [Mycena olivaceomarginata]|nr:hypothetical protein B0H14DRAFT_3426891 [Mycena olivaceomarginata]